MTFGIFIVEKYVGPPLTQDHTLLLDFLLYGLIIKLSPSMCPYQAQMLITPPMYTTKISRYLLFMVTAWNIHERKLRLTVLAKTDDGRDRGMEECNERGSLIPNNSSVLRDITAIKRLW
jgi:hypothetical protein